MDEEAKRALNEVFHILQNTSEEQPVPTIPVETPVGEAQRRPEEEPTVIYPYEHKPPIALDLKGSKKSVQKVSKRHWIQLVELAVAIIILTVIIVLVILPLVEPTATVIIIPSVTTITTTSTIEVEGRTLASLTLTQARTDQTTGTGHQDAQTAHGIVTFYNALPSPQTIPAGELLTGSDGVQVITDQIAYLPAGTLATNGQATVSAHAVVVGPQGNIKGGDIYGACCRMNVFVANGPFSGGTVARSFPMVTQSDLDNATKHLQASLMPGITASLTAELHQGETSTPAICTTKASSDHKAVEEATQITTTLTATCTAFAYQTQDILAQMRTRLTQATEAQLGDGYSMVADPVITVEKSWIQGSRLTLQVKSQAHMAYQFQEQLARIKAHIAGMSKAQAITWLTRLPGVSSVSVDITNGTDTSTLPRDTSAIHCTILYTGQE
jgi:hypothetical protein